MIIPQKYDKKTDYHACLRYYFFRRRFRETVRGAYRTPLSQTNFRSIILYVGFSPVNVSDTAKKHYLCTRQDRRLFYERA